MKISFFKVLFVLFVFGTNLHGQVTTSSQISSVEADAEEIVSNGVVDLNSNSLEVLHDLNGTQKMGLHFENLNIPSGAIIDSVYVEIVPSNQSPDSLSVNVYAEASDNPLVWSANNLDITNRIKTSAMVNVAPSDYNVIPYGNWVKMQTFDLSPIVQEVVNRPGYNSQAPINLILERDFGGNQGAISYDSIPSDAPKLFVIYNEDTIAPISPTLSLAGQSDSTIDLTWTASSDNNTVSGYNVYKDGVLETALDNVLTYQVTGLEASTSYNFSITAYDAAGNESVVSNTIASTTNSSMNFYSLEHIRGADDTVIGTMTDGYTTTVNNATTFNVNAVPSSSIGSTFFALSGPVSYSKNENTSPYSLYGDGSGGNFYDGPDLTPGDYTLTITAWSEANSTGTQIAEDIIGFTVLSSSEETIGHWSLNNQDVYYNEGNVGVGTSTPDEKLTVKGTVHAEEVKVDLSVPAPDYVFKADYNLTSLEELQEYVSMHGHLPNIPSAKEMEANGVELGIMNMKLLEKIEELTLYILEHDELIKKLKIQLNNKTE